MQDASPEQKTKIQLHGIVSSAWWGVGQISNEGTAPLSVWRRLSPTVFSLPPSCTHDPMGNEASRGGGSNGGMGPPPGSPMPQHMQQQQQQQQQSQQGATSKQGGGPRPPRDPLYHMKLVVRGERGVGKSSLLDRLKGRPFLPGRQATREIQVDTFPWQYKNMDDKIEVEVWDVVDRARSGQAGAGAGDEDDAPAGA